MAFNLLGLFLANKLVGFTSDGASVNRGDKNSVKTLLRDDYSWLVFIWCIAHHLELALEDALKGTRFDGIDEMLLRSYYLYQKAPKKLRQLRELFEMYRGAMDYLSDSCKPKKASGTRWISHKLGAMKTVLDKLGLYIQHLENLTEDKSLKAKDRSKMKVTLESGLKQTCHYFSLFLLTCWRHRPNFPAHFGMTK